MSNCLLCQNKVYFDFNLEWLMSFQKYSISKVCSRCNDSFEEIKASNCCLGCGRKQNQQMMCLDCRQWKKRIRGELLDNKALYVYDQTAMRSFIEKYKFLGDYRLRLVFQNKFEKFISVNYDKDWLYVPIPIDEETMQIRGFNQIEGLTTNIPLTRVISMREKRGRIKQSHKNKKERMLTKQPFKISEQISQLKKAKILLLDDIYTTGRTLYHARNLLMQHGAETVKSITLCR